MVRRHSFNRRAQQDLRESIRRSREQCQIQGIADVKNARDIDDVLSFTDHTLANISRKSPPSYLEATTGSGFRCHYMKRYANINNSDV
ncbi:unnamed protein product [Rhizophagus irregularis]|uniref:Uncharacterized protein n=1 Tax=Rhizophagus irregularis TaxID=588596 RepID=A0A2N1N225_9GLOM|nr:hypothetical protein RhiirC2_782900 [Rhizophagus irregularis]CAB4389985.1 unnamed protein product [Rhizophagus irregularis]CAB5370330.1 unnamed protein product [Rhizophagus irregularis]